MNLVYLLIGGNQGNREDFLSQSKLMIASKMGKILQQSSIYETAAWGPTPQPHYLNQVLAVESTLQPDQLLSAALAIEAALGRKRENERYGPRTIDIDILFIGDMIIKAPHLLVPHPQIVHRRFVLVPMAEIAPNFSHPELELTMSQLLQVCADSLDVNKFLL